MSFRLHQQNVEVVGAEFSKMAIVEFFNESNLKYEVKEIDEHSSIYEGINCESKITFYQGDFFAMPDNDQFKHFDVVWDRAAMVAINPGDRGKYAEKIMSILSEKGTLLLSAMVREEGRDGPPHTLTECQISAAYKPLGFQLSHLEMFEDLSSVSRLGKLEVHTFQINRCSLLTEKLLQKSYLGKQP